jgi:superfamily II DNA or RNA helicase
MDNKDIFSLCDDNVVYEISLKQSIEKRPAGAYYYYAIYDPTDYDDVRIANGSYVIEDLERQLSHTERADLVLEHYRKLARERCLGFCVSIKHAEYMAKYFSDHGIPSAAVHSGELGNGHALDRDAAIEALEEGRIKAVFAVDMFNEGVDVPSLDTVMFLRPHRVLCDISSAVRQGTAKTPGQGSPYSDRLHRELQEGALYSSSTCRGQPMDP